MSERHPDPGTPVRVMTYNIRFDTPDDGENAWSNRKERVASLIRYHAPDSLGIQEALHGQLEDLATLLPEYGWAGVGREGERSGEFSAILYRRDALQPTAHSTFWLSGTPDVPASHGWDAHLPRVVTWCEYRRPDGDVWYHFNTHIDHLGRQAQIESANLLLERLDSIAEGRPAVVTGDFNFLETLEPYRILASRLRDAFHVQRERNHGPHGTFFGFPVTDEPGIRIDYVFVTEAVTVRRYATISESELGMYPSDHLPIVVDLTL